MFRPSRRRVTILLLLVLALVGPWAAAAEAGGRAEPALWQSWDLAARFWAALIELWGQSGCSLDPDGTCGAGSQSQSGCSVDPSGRCVGGGATPASQSGCTVDPSGGCGQ